MNKQTTIPVMSTRNLAYCALLAALSVVLARLIIPMPPPGFPSRRCPLCWPVSSLALCRARW